MDLNTYRKTLSGVITRMYGKMYRRVVHGECNHPELYLGKALLPAKQFRKIALRSRKLKRLHANWVKQNYRLSVRPTPNRIDSNKGYTKKNIEFVTYADNVRKGHGRHKSKRL